MADFSECLPLLDWHDHLSNGLHHIVFALHLSIESARILTVDWLCQVKSTQQSHTKRVSIGLLQVCFRLDPQLRSSEEGRCSHLADRLSPIGLEAVRKASQLVTVLFSRVEHIAGADVIVGNIGIVKSGYCLG